ncbi:amidohydrolase family protein [Actinospica durhamensis]|uniref:Amidohydrolase family protein n=1 Tax=Actinospica durhamensis TaxID=1508375 RepID=A0A941EW60_9ACTN|nr:amidohydrolase family protein [Actinospica durhamensis]MBR7838403.1 amidohydrolase family protein [Actinospica durhamensis]
MGDARAASTLIEHVRVFDGVADVLSDPRHVLVRDGLIASITAEPPEPAAFGGDCVRIEAAGHTLMPGLIDAHWHAAFASLSFSALQFADAGFIAIAAAHAARETLLRGFTTVRDAGGPTFGLKLAIDRGLTAGPRIYPSGAFISQTAGHGDFRTPNEVPRGLCGHLSHAEIVGASAIADGVEEVLRAAREQLMRGASQLKMMAGGGAASTHDPIDVTQYTEAELRAGVEAAENWGTYVMVHAYTSRAVQQALRAGVRCIDHGHLGRGDRRHDRGEERVVVAATLPRRRGRHPAGVGGEPGQADARDRRHRHRLHTRAQTRREPRLGHRHPLRRQAGHPPGRPLVKMRRWFSPAEVLRMATSTNARLLTLSGERNPYPGVLGQVKEGAIADLLLVAGDPLTDLDLLARPDASLALIMKDGVVYKNTLTAAAPSAVSG